MKLPQERYLEAATTQEEVVPPDEQGELTIATP